MTPDSRIPRWIALAAAAAAAAILATAIGAYFLLERREAEGLRGEVARAASEGASRLSREVAAVLRALPEKAGEPPGAPAEGFFAEAVAVGADGARLFPPPAEEWLPGGELPGAEAVEVAEMLAAAGREPEALEAFEAAARGSTAEVAWRSWMGMAAVYERSGRADRAVPYLERAASVQGHPFLAISARLRRAEALRAAGDAGRARAEHISLLDDLAKACESWAGRAPAPLEPEAARVLLEKSRAGLRALGGELPAGAFERIEEALAARRRVEAVARALAGQPGGPGFIAVGGAAGAAGEPPGGGAVFAFRRRKGDGIEAFCLRWSAWERKAAEVSEGIRAGGMALAFRLVPPGGKAAEGPAAAAPLGPPPLDGLLLEAAPAPGAFDAALRGFRLRIGLVLGALAALFLAGLALGARNLLRAAALSRARAEFAISTSHEIKTPLTLIRAASETLATRDLDAAARRPYLKTLVVESRRLSEIVGRVLDLRRLEESPGPLERSSCDLAALAREAVESFRPLLDEEGFTCEVLAPEEVRASVDPEAIANALLALLENALRYTPPEAGPERKRIEVRVRAEAGEAAIEVADRGIGIPPEERERVFERYHRVRSELFPRVRGAGLGLTIVREIVERHGGRVRIEGNAPAGTAVRIALPREA